MIQDNTGNANIESDEISLKELILKIQDWWRFLLSKWVIILIASVIGGTLGLAYSYLKKPVYKAQLTFALEDDKSSAGGLGAAMGLASQFGIDLGSSGGGAFAGDNLLELMKSRSMVESTLLATIDVNGRKETLAELYISFNRLREHWEDDPKLGGIKFLPNTEPSKFTLQQDSVLGVFWKAIIKNNLSVDRVNKKASIIAVNVDSKNEAFSKFFTEILVKTVSDFYILTKTKKSVQNVGILQRQTDSVRRELNAAINGVAASVDVNPNANPAMQVLKVPSQRRLIDVQTNTAILGELLKNLEISKVSLRKETPLIQVIDKPILPLEKDKVDHVIAALLGALIAGILTLIIIFLGDIFKNILAGE